MATQMLSTLTLSLEQALSTMWHVPLQVKKLVSNIISNPETARQRRFSVLHTIGQEMWCLTPQEDENEMDRQLKPQKNIWATHLNVYIGKAVKTKSWPFPNEVDHTAKEELSKQQWELYKKFTDHFLSHLQLIPTKTGLPELFQSDDPKQIYENLPTELQISLYRQVLYKLNQVDVEVAEKLREKGFCSNQDKIEKFLKSQNVYKGLFNSLSVVGISPGEYFFGDYLLTDETDGITDGIQPLFEMLPRLTKDQQAFHQKFNQIFLKWD